MLLINRYEIDPVDITPKNNLEALFYRHSEAIPQQNEDEPDDEYCGRVRQVSLLFVQVNALGYLKKL